MNNQLLHRLITQFSTESLIAFLSDKNPDFEPIRTPLRNYPSEDFSQALEVGELPFGHAESLGVYSFRVNKALSERSGKKAQYDLAKKVLKDAQQDAGIFVFYDAQGNFRFSLVYADYHGTKVDWSTFKRFTYFVSPQLTNKTFLQRVGECTFSSLEEIKDAFSVEKVTKKFYEEISYWYFWACQKCRFPKAAEEEENGRQISVIRLITRMIFVWFMREKDLVKPNLFNREIMRGVLKELEDDSSSYYLAILQNLFFATLNTPQKERRFRSEARFNKRFNPDFNNHSVYRHQDFFKQPDKMEELFSDIAFLNGGLFECLDEKDKKIYIDGFTDIKTHQPYVPNDLFFSDEQQADFNTEMGTAGKTYKVKGLLEILNAYNFTIDENTVDDKEVALDPELLGRVFENLLASFNPETSTTARKATGSYYTPREIVDYMVDESLKAYFRSHMPESEDVEEKIETLFSNDESSFSEDETKQLVKLVESVRLVDPAVGSGAFPMGALNKLVFILSKLDPNNALWKQAQLDVAEQIPDYQLRVKTKETIENYFQEKNPDYGRKLYLIQKCIYGVDIQQIAVEIAKLRFFISLLVEETVEKDKDNWGIEPLPNLDFKIMQGNSLISEYGGLRFELDANKQAADMLAFEDENSKQIKEFEQLKEAYQAEADRAKKKELQDKIDKLVAQIAENLARKQKEGYFSRVKAIEDKYAHVPDSEAKRAAMAAEKEKLAKQSGFDWAAIEAELKQFGSKRKVQPFFPWQLYFAEVFKEKGGFDIVIGNPPYIGEKGHKKLFEPVKQANLKKFYMGKMDYFYFFFHLALEIGKLNSQVAFISTNYYITATGAVKLRKDLHERATINKLVNFNELKIFESATGQHNMITLYSKGTYRDKVADTCITHRTGFASPQVITRIISWTDDKTEYFKVPQNYLYDGNDFQIRLRGTNNLTDNSINNILNKIKQQSEYLDKFCNINQGIQTGADKVSSRHIKKYNIKDPPGTGIFVLSASEIEKLNLSLEDKKLLKPWYKNSNIMTWKTINKTSEAVIYADKRKRNLENTKLKYHLLRFQDIINDSSANAPYLHRPRDILFDGPKIVAPQRSYRNTFGYNEISWYASSGVYIITEKDKDVSLKYLLALLNSQLYYLWLYFRGKRKGKALELVQKPLSEIPIKKINAEKQKPFIEKVDQILALVYSEDYPTNKTKQEQVKALENELNQMVYDLYGLSEEERSIVENFKQPKGSIESH